jgi:MFS family permease
MKLIKNHSDNNSDEEIINISNTNQEIITIDRIIDDLGFHKYNIMMLFLEFIALFCDGIEIYTVFLLLPILKDKYRISNFENSIVVSCAILGTALGVLFSGILTQKYGERKPFISISLLIAVFGSLSVAVDNLIWFCFCRLIVGFSIGVIINYVNCLYENLPSSNRRFVSIIIFVSVEIGILFYTFLFYIYTLDTLPINVYKEIVVVSTIPMYLCFVLSFFFFQESPRKLLWNKKYDELFETLDKYSGRKDYLSRQQKRALIDLVEKKEKEELEKRESNLMNEHYDTSTYFGRLNLAFVKDSTGIILQVILWSIAMTLILSCTYYLPKYLDNVNINSEVKISNRNLELLELNNSNSLNIESLKNTNENRILSSSTSYITDKLAQNNNNSKSKNDINSINNNNSSYLNNHSFLKLKNSKSKMNSSEKFNKLNRVLLQLRSKQVVKSESDVKKIEKNTKKYKKVMISTVISMLGETFPAILAMTNIRIKHLVAIAFFLCGISSSMKVYFPIYMEYFSSALKISDKICINFMRLYTSGHFHTDYRETVYVFCGFISRFVIVFSPFIIDYFFSLDVFLPCYFEVLLSLTGFMLTLMLVLDDPEKKIDHVEIKLIK